MPDPDRCRRALLGTDDGLWDWDLQGTFYVCPRWRGLLGLPAHDEPAHPRDWFERVHPDDQQSLRLALGAHLTGRTAHFRHEHRMRHAGGGWRWMLCRGRAERGVTGVVRRLAGTMTDVTAQVAARDTLRHAAFHDCLTGPGNRALLLPLVAAAIERRRQSAAWRYAVLFLDVDRFKHVNDAYGHAAGDALLVAMARRLEASLRATDTACRLGGDEFAVLLSALDTPAQALDIATRVQGALCSTYEIAGRELGAEVSIGGVVGHEEVDSPDALLAAADGAMYTAKAAGRQRPIIAGLEPA